MATTANAFGLLLEDGEPGADRSGKKRNRKKKAKAPAAQPAAGIAEAGPAAPEAQPEAAAPQPVQHDEGPPDGFQTVVKGSRGKSLPAAKSVESLPGAALAADARRTAEAQAGSPAIQDTIETWAHKLEREKSPAYLDEGGKLLSWREVLLSSAALESLLGTCLSERLDASLEGPLASVLLACAGGRGPEPQRLSQGVAATVVRLAGSLQPGAGPDHTAALALLRRLLALLLAPPQAAPARPPPAAAAAAAVPDLEAQLGRKAAALRAAKPAKQAELWREVQALLDAGSGSVASPQAAPEPPAAAALAAYESALRELQQDPAAQKQAAREEAERLQASQASLEARLKEAHALVQSLQQQLATVQQGIAANQARAEQPRAQVSGPALQQQLAAAAALRASLGCEQAPPQQQQQQPAGAGGVGPAALAALAEAASALLVTQLKQQRELATRGRHTADRLARKKTQVAQLAGLGDGREHRAVAAQLQQLEQEAQKHQRESAGICHLAESAAATLQRAGAGPQPVLEAGQIAAACRQQHAAILEGPLRLGTPWLESLVHGPPQPPQPPQQQQLQPQVPAPAQGLPSPIARPQPAAPLQQPPPPQQQAPPEAAAVQASAYNQWAAEGSPVQPAWGLPPPASSFGELLQGSSVSQAPSKVPAPIAPASLGLAALGGEPAPRPPVPSLPPVGNAPIGSAAPTPRQNGGLPHEQQAQQQAAAAGSHSSANGVAAAAGDGSGKPKRSRPRKQRAPGA